MEEKIIIESTHSKKINVICSAIIIVLYVVYCEAMYLSNDAWTTFGYWFVRRIFIPIIFLALIFFSTRTNICVTNMRVYGKAFWGKRVDLPLDSISAVAIGFGHSIIVSTSSGKIAFSEIDNRNEIYEEINKLLMERQHNSHAMKAPTINQESHQSNADEIKNIKNFLILASLHKKNLTQRKNSYLDCRNCHISVSKTFHCICSFLRFFYYNFVTCLCFGFCKIIVHIRFENTCFFCFCLCDFDCIHFIIDKHNIFLSSPLGVYRLVAALILFRFYFLRFCFPLLMILV